MNDQETLRVDRVLETCLYATDLERTGDFYRSVLRLEEHARVDGRHVFFRCGDGMLLLFDPETTAASSSEVPLHGARGPGHVAFAIGAEEIDDWRSRLVRAGVEVEAEVSWPAGGRSLYSRDPADNSVELTSPTIWRMEDVGGRVGGDLSTRDDTELRGRGGDDRGG